MKLFISEPEERHQGAILVHDEAMNDIAEFYHNEHATVETSYETALALAKKLTGDVAQPALPWPSREVVAREIRRAMLDNPTDDSFNKRAEKREEIADVYADIILARFAAAKPPAAPRVPKVRTSHHRNAEEAARLQALVDKRFGPDVSQPPAAPVETIEEIVQRIKEACAEVSDRYAQKSHDARRCGAALEISAAIRALIPTPVVHSHSSAGAATDAKTMLDVAHRLERWPPCDTSTREHAARIIRAFVASGAEPQAASVPDGATHMRRPEYITAWLFDRKSTMPVWLIEQYKSRPLPDDKIGHYATAVDGEFWRWFDPAKFDELFTSSQVTRPHQP